MDNARSGAIADAAHPEHTGSLDATAACELFLAAARDGGMTHVCISPGSRSTPLAVGAMRTRGLTTSIHLDERVGAFAALGRAVATGRPVGLICTSGTAGANYLPAVSEASMSHIPLVVMTADRPPEHQSWGVGQTFEQAGLYHRQVRHEFSMPVGGDGGRPFSHRMGWRAVCTAVEKHGPVHVNWPFRLPLEPGEEPLEVAPTFVAPNSSGIDEAPCHSGEVQALQRSLANAAHPVIIAGPNTFGAALGSASSKAYAERLCTAAAEAHIPILADALSGLRGPGREALIAYPALVTERAERDGLEADLIIHLGHTPTAKRLRLWWESTSAEHVLIDPRSEWQDPSHLASQRFTSHPVELLEQALGAAVPAVDHLTRWTAAGASTARICTNNRPEMTEHAVVDAIATHALANDVLVASSSMPVRDIDTFLEVTAELHVHANRGINGIDGVIATASGISAARSTHHYDAQTFVLIGDVALLHDIGGVLDAARNGVSLTIIVANDDGGGIFSFLPARSALDDETFDYLFQTPHGSTFAFLDHYPGIRYVATDDVHTTLSDLAPATDGVTVTVIEVDTAGIDRTAATHKLIEQIRTT